MASAKSKAICAENQLSRRNILAAPLMVAVAGAYAEGARAAEAVGETPVMALFREWKVLFDHINTNGGDLPQDQFNAMCDERIALENRIAATPSRTAGDFAAKFVALTNDGDDVGMIDPNFSPQLWAEARALVA